MATLSVLSQLFSKCAGRLPRGTHGSPPPTPQKNRTNGIEVTCQLSRTKALKIREFVFIVHFMLKVKG